MTHSNPTMTVDKEEKIFIWKTGMGSIDADKLANEGYTIIRLELEYEL
jgi:hypothetical protein